MQRTGKFFRRITGGNANGADLGQVLSGQVDERRGHLAPVAELERALTEPAAGDDPDGVGGAAVDFNEGDEALAVAAARLVDTQTPAAEHGHPNAENLARAQ